MLTTTIDVSRGGVVCPSASSISPCTCHTYDPDSVKLHCFNLGLSDSQMSKILNNFLNPNRTSPLVHLYAYNNNLTKIPSEISKFTSIQWIGLASNQITSIPSGAFLSSATSFHINLESNQITSISSSAFNLPSATSEVHINLNYNKVKSIPSDSFNFASATYVEIWLQLNKITSIPSGSFKFRSAKKIEIVLNVNKIMSIPSDAFDYPSATSVDINLGGNQITSIPSGSFKFPSATSVDIFLSYNQIASIPSGAFNFPSATSVRIELESNQITSIPPNTFSKGDNNKFNSLFSMRDFIMRLFYLFHIIGTGKFTRIALTNNKLTQFDSNVFETPLKNLIGSDGFDHDVYIGKSIIIIKAINHSSFHQSSSFNLFILI